MRASREPGDRRSEEWQLLTDGAWAMGGGAASAVIGIGVLAVLSRLLTAELLGAYVLGASVAGGAAVVARGGFERAVLQQVSHALGRDQEARARGLIRTSLALTTVTALLVAAVLWVGVGRWMAEVLFGSPPLMAAAALLGPWVVTSTFEALTTEIFRSVRDIPRASFLGTPVTRLLSLLSFALAIGVGASVGLRAAIATTIACTVVSVLLSAYLLRQRLGSGPAEPMRELARPMLRSAWPLWLHGITAFLIGSADLWILGAVRGDADVALYVAASRLAALVAFLPGIVNAVVPPLMGQVHARNERERLERIVRCSASVTLVPSAALGLVLLVGATPIMGAVYGPDYGAGAAILAVLAVGRTFSAAMGSSGFALIMTGHERDLLVASVVAGAIGVLGGVALGTRHGGLGVAVAATVALLVHRSITVAAVRLRCGFWTVATPRHLAMALRGLRTVGRGV